MNPGTPISAVTIPGAWSGPPSTSVSTTVSSSAVEITAIANMPSYGLFLKWLQFGDGSIASPVLTVPASGASLAIAYFDIPIPDPCQSIRTELDSLSPADLPTPAAYEAAVKALARELLACEQKNGEVG